MKDYPNSPYTDTTNEISLERPYRQRFELRNASDRWICAFIDENRDVEVLSVFRAKHPVEASREMLSLVKQMESGKRNEIAELEKEIASLKRKLRRLSEEYMSLGDAVSAVADFAEFIQDPKTGEISEVQERK